MDAHDVYTSLLAQVNGPAYRFERVFTERFSVEHPTLQQALMRHVLVPALKVLVKEHMDARNEASVAFAMRTLEATKDIGLPCIW